jgi:hypothetical protein
MQIMKYSICTVSSWLCLSHDLNTVDVSRVAQNCKTWTFCLVTTSSSLRPTRELDAQQQVAALVCSSCPKRGVVTNPSIWYHWSKLFYQGWAPWREAQTVAFPLPLARQLLDSDPHHETPSWGKDVLFSRCLTDLFQDISHRDVLSWLSDVLITRGFNS